MFNEVVQTTIVILAMIIATLFLVYKFFVTPKRKKATKTCGNDDCGC